MDFWKDLWMQVSQMKWSDYLDIALVAILICRLIPTLRLSGAMRVARIVVLVLLLTWITDLLNLSAMNYLLEELLSIGLIAVIVLYQPELRRFLDRLSSVRLKRFLGISTGEEDVAPIIRQTVMACEIMSRERVGALMVFARDQSLDEYLRTGTMIDAQVSEQLIRNIFFPKASLHDGAMLICGGRVAAAGCVLPLSESHRLSADLGTRHRAGVGMSETTDAVVVIVSEETGTISVAVGGMLKRHLAPQTLEKLLRAELCKEDSDSRKSLTVRLQQKLSKKDKGGQSHEK